VKAWREMTEGRGAGGRRKVERIVASVGAMMVLEEGRTPKEWFLMENL
jgi:hypothetical protein